MTDRLLFVMVSGAYMPPDRDGDIVAYSGGLTTYRLFPRPTQTEAEGQRK